MHLYQHGLPCLLCKVDAPPSSRKSTTSAGNPRQRSLSKDIIQAALAEAVHWIATLARTLSDRQKDVHMPVLRMLSARLDDLSPEQRQERQVRIASFRSIAVQIAKAKRLATDRDSGKRRFDDMCADDQQLLEELETGRLQKRRRKTLPPRAAPFRSQLSPSTLIDKALPSFRSQMDSASAAAEHAAASSTASAAAEHAAVSSTASAKVSLSSSEDDD